MKDVHNSPSSYQAASQGNFSSVRSIYLNPSGASPQLQGSNISSSAWSSCLHSVTDLLVQYQCVLPRTNLAASAAAMDEENGPCSNLSADRWHLHANLPFSLARQGRCCPAANCMGRSCGGHVSIAVLGDSTQNSGDSAVHLAGMGRREICWIPSRRRHIAHGSWWTVIHTWRYAAAEECWDLVYGMLIVLSSIYVDTAQIHMTKTLLMLCCSFSICSQVAKPCTQDVWLP